MSEEKTELLCVKTIQHGNKRGKIRIFKKIINSCTIDYVVKLYLEEVEKQYYLFSTEEELLSKVAEFEGVLINMLTYSDDKLISKLRKMGYN